jgi:hypothetical protein
MSNYANDKRETQRKDRDARAKARSEAKVYRKEELPSSSSDQETEERYIERRINEDGEEEIRMCDPGFRPPSATDPRYCSLADFTIRMLSEILT